MNVDEAFEHIKRSFDSGRLASGYIVDGPVRGAGRDFVDQVMQLIFCEEDDKPCGVCRGCREARNRTHSDLIWVEPQKKSRIISVEQVRSLESRVYKTSYAGGWKVCVVCAADRLRDSSANAFLKTLEEPPEKTIFFLLTSNPQFLLPTIISRCQRITVAEEEDVPKEPWCDDMADILVDVGRCKPIGDFALADRMTALLKGVKADVEADEKEAVADEAVDEDSDSVDARVNARYLEARGEIMCYIMHWYRDVMLLVSGAGDEHVMNSERVDDIHGHASRLNYRQARANMAVIESMNQQFERNIPEQSVLSYGFSRLS